MTVGGSPRGCQGRLGFAGYLAVLQIESISNSPDRLRFSHGVLLDGGMLDVDNESRTIDYVGMMVG